MRAELTGVISAMTFNFAHFQNIAIFSAIGVLLFVLFAILVCLVRCCCRSRAKAQEKKRREEEELEKL